MLKLNRRVRLDVPLSSASTKRGVAGRSPLHAKKRGGRGRRGRRNFLAVLVPQGHARAVRPWKSGFFYEPLVSPVRLSREEYRITRTSGNVSVCCTVVLSTVDTCTLVSPRALGKFHGFSASRWTSHLDIISTASRCCSHVCVSVSLEEHRN